MVVLGKGNMVSEDLKKIAALIIVTFSFVLIPILLFFFAVMIYFNLAQIIRFFHTRVMTDALMVVSLAIANTVLFFAIRALIRWVRK